jgi:two-component system CheB/CheR fusion protein
MPKSIKAKDSPTEARPRASHTTPPATPPVDDYDGLTVVGIGASAGGLDACTKLIGALPGSSPGGGMAFILVQHLDPTHASMMVDLLAEHTKMPVLQAADGMIIERDHFYIIPPGTDLAVSRGALHLSQPKARHGARLPFDFLLHSLAEAYGAHAVCVVLSGTGADGSVGLKAIKEKHGLVIAQDPEEADYDGMPRSAIMTELVDFVLPIAKIPAALVDRHRRAAHTPRHGAAVAQGEALDPLAAIVDLLRTTTAHDFTLYKEGTLRRRIERRMGMAGIESDGMDSYLRALRDDSGELALLAKDLLINVTSFFRDPKIFDVLENTIIPEMLRGRPHGQALRIWIAGCSTGEETYSLTMLFREHITAINANIKLQVFASDVDPDAVATARDGIYPESIAQEVSPARLERFFSKEGEKYRVLPELRAAVVFTVQDVLADPPFSRLDFVSCRNLLIYLKPEAQARIVSIFHFALREGGILLLGNSETIGPLDGRFEVISKSDRLYRHVGRARPGEFDFLMRGGDGPRLSGRADRNQAAPRQVALAELCRRLVIETHAPAAVLINRRRECLYSLGPTDRYLRVAPGNPSHDLLAMARDGLRGRLVAAIERATQENVRIVVAGGHVNEKDRSVPFNIDVQPVKSDGEQLLLVSFVDEPLHEPKHRGAMSPNDVPRVVELEQELEATRIELRGALRNLEISTEEQSAINEEALSVNEEFQSTNEELLTSKEELQSLNEELTALNSQLHETLERQRTTANDLQNILYSTDVATLFLDRELRIRFFTPATKALFNVIPTDIGRPLADLNSLAGDADLLSDAKAMLRSQTPSEREIQALSGAWFIRRILPYRTRDGVEGVVITFTDITERKLAAKALEAAKQDAEGANAAKSRFLASASHDLRQPLQTLSLLQGLLAKKLEGSSVEKLVNLFEHTLGAMGGMLNALLDINQIDAGIVQPVIVDFPIDDKLRQLRDEFSYHAQAKGLILHVVGCGLWVRSDRGLLEQMVRNLLSNAMKYTERGKVLLGCRRHGDMLSIEVWDTGIGIPDSEFQSIFEEYHQIDNPARERSRGLGLGLSIVQRLGALLGHKVHVHSHAGKGSVFSVDVPISRDAGAKALTADPAAGPDGPNAVSPARTGAILAIDDDPEVLDLIHLVLKDEGHHVVTVRDGAAALEAIAHGTINPDLILADYNLPNGVDGLVLAAKLRKTIRRRVPVIILTGDISTEVLQDITAADCVRLRKPVGLDELTGAIQNALPPSRPDADATSIADAPVIYVVDDDRHVREMICTLLKEDGRSVAEFATCEAFLGAFNPKGEGCLLIDAYLPGMTGLELLRRLADLGYDLPAIMITGNSDVSVAIQAMKSGAVDFIEKPIAGPDLLASIDSALAISRDSHQLHIWKETAANQLAGLTLRQRQIMDMVLAGHPSKNIAADLGISQRTVENHRAAIMKKAGAKSLPALARLALAAA